jgi:hypothetical protein
MMDRYEYTVHRTTGGDALEEDLNAIAQGGWRLVKADVKHGERFPGSTVRRKDEWTLIFERALT